MRLRREMGDFQITGVAIAGASDEYVYYHFTPIRTGLGAEDFNGQIVTLKVPVYDATDGYDPANGIAAEAFAPIVAVSTAIVNEVKYVVFAVNWSALSAVVSDMAGSSDNSCWYYNPATGTIVPYNLIS